MPITHEWNGTILTITSDSGTSSMDLQGSKGDDGCRGPQGPAGIIVDSVGNIDWNGYATEDYVDDQIINAVGDEPVSVQIQSFFASVFRELQTKRTVSIAGVTLYLDSNDNIKIRL